MHVEKIIMDQPEAEKLYKRYLKDKHYGEGLDDEIRAAYRAIAKGDVVIRAIASIAAAGLKADGLPHLAISRATVSHCHLYMFGSGAATMANTSRGLDMARGDRIVWHPGTFSATDNAATRNKNWRIEKKAARPIIPLDIRPRRALESYHVLWEAEWEPVPPVDPYLLRRIGRADMFVVCGAWNLTEVERAAMATRIGAN